MSVAKSNTRETYNYITNIITCEKKQFGHKVILDFAVLFTVMSGIYSSSFG